jgi:hypothetical protein
MEILVKASLAVALVVAVSATSSAQSSAEIDFIVSGCWDLKRKT